MARLHPYTKQWADDDLIFDDNLLKEALSITGPYSGENFECLNSGQFLIDELVFTFYVKRRQNLGELRWLHSLGAYFEDVSFVKRAVALKHI